MNYRHFGIRFVWWSIIRAVLAACNIENDVDIVVSNRLNRYEYGPKVYSAAKCFIYNLAAGGGIEDIGWICGETIY